MTSVTCQDFIEGRVRTICRFAFSLIASIVVVVCIWQPSIIAPIPHGNEEAAQTNQTDISTPRGSRHEFPSRPEPRPPESSPTPSNQPIANTNPEPPVDSQPTQAQTQSIDSASRSQPEVVTEHSLSQSEPVTEKQNPNQANPRGPANQPSQTEQGVSETQFQIIAGQNAAHFAFESLEAMKQAARDHGCRFVITDGSFSVEIGRDLGDVSNIRSIGADWHLLYARRMVKLPFDEQVIRAIDAGCRRYSQLDRGRACAYLSITNTVDQTIFAAQLQHQPVVDVRDTTIIRLKFGGQCEIVGVEKAGQ